MSNVFRVELSGGNNRYCILDLPATDYELLDALERLQMKPGEKPNWEITDHNGFNFLHAHLIDECDLYQLNALANRLDKLNNKQKIAFEGLFDMEVAKKYGPIRISTMIDLAYSTECCHVLDVTTDAQLGRFYAENGFIPDVESVPDSIFELLDFEQLGRKARIEEGGVFTERGYVTQHSELEQVYESLTLVPKTPKYAFRLLLNNFPFDESNYKELNVPLELPATAQELDDALGKLDAPSWEEVVFRANDSAIPGILDDADLFYDGIQQINNLAQAIKYREGRDELPKLKAVLDAADCRDISTAISIAENLDDYLYEPDERTAEEVAMEELRFTVDMQTLSILQKYVNLFDYGMELISVNNATMTPYGLVERRDGEMVLDPEDSPAQGGMEMK